MRNLSQRAASLFELSGPSGRMVAMEGLRGLAIIMVLVCHFIVIIAAQLSPAYVGHSDILRTIEQASGAGVDVFFALSGFLIYRTAIKPKLSLGKFYYRRFERIYPTFFFLLTLYYLLSVLHLVPSRVPTGSEQAARYLLANALFLPGMFDIQAMISAAWSLSYEWLFYLVLPLALLSVRASKAKASVRIAVIIGLIVLYPIWCYAYAPHFPVFQNWDQSHARITLFFAGMLVSELFHQQSYQRITAKPASQLSAIIVLLVTFGILIYCEYLATPGMHTADPAQWIRLSAIRAFDLSIFSATLIIFTLSPGTIFQRIFSFRYLRYLGNMSYSVYLIHSLALHITELVVRRVSLQHAFSTAEIYTVAIVLAAVSTIFLSTALFACIEKPFSLATRPRSEVAALTSP